MNKILIILALFGLLFSCSNNYNKSNTNYSYIEQKVEDFGKKLGELKKLELKSNSTGCDSIKGFWLFYNDTINILNIPVDVGGNSYRYPIFSKDFNKHKKYILKGMDIFSNEILEMPYYTELVSIDTSEYDKIYTFIVTMDLCYITSCRADKVADFPDLFYIKSIFKYSEQKGLYYYSRLVTNDVFKLPFEY